MANNIVRAITFLDSLLAIVLRLLSLINSKFLNVNPLSGKIVCRVIQHIENLFIRDLSQMSLLN